MNFLPKIHRSCDKIINWLDNSFSIEVQNSITIVFKNSIAILENSDVGISDSQIIT